MLCDRIEFNRATFIAGSFAAASVGLPEVSRGAATAGPGVAPDDALAQMMAGNARFVDNEFPPITQLEEKRAMLKESQAPFAAVLSCADSRVIPELIFVQGLGELFVTRVAGNYPDDVVLGSLEYAVEHLGTRLIMALGHQNCGAVKAVYSAIETDTPLQKHLDSIEHLIAPGIESVVRSRGGIDAAIAANARAAAAALRAAPPILSKGVETGHVRVVSAVYQLGSGKVRLLE